MSGEPLVSRLISLSAAIWKEKKKYKIKKSLPAFLLVTVRGPPGVLEGSTATTLSIFYTSAILKIAVIFTHKQTKKKS